MTSKTILIQSEVIGRGEDNLGAVLMANFLRNLGESEEKPKAIIFWNTGVRLLTADSPVLEHLKKLAGQGIEILGCATCLDYLNLTDKIKVGKTTNMLRSIYAMFDTDMICL
jgi:selenium metabolism protein YedF